MNANVRLNLLNVVIVSVVLMALVDVAVAQAVAPQNKPVAGTESIGLQFAQTALGTAFTYQGQLKNASGPVNGNCDFQFSLWNAPFGLIGQIGTTQLKTGVNVNGGFFTVQLDFGDRAFTGDARWLQIAVKCSADSDFVTLVPRQMLTPAPYALYAPASGTTSALLGRAISTTAPSAGQVLKWNGTQWSPAADAIGTPGIGDISAVYAGYGLSGGGTTGDVTLAVVTSTIQQRVAGTCAGGSSIRAVNADGTVTCETDDNTTYSAGAGLNLIGAQFSITPTYRLPQGCGNNQVVKWSGNAWGCANDDVGGSNYWSLSGNAGTNPNTNLIGTTDNVSLTLAVSGTAALRLVPGPSAPNMLGGANSNRLQPGVSGATVAGGRNISVTGDYATVGGGEQNRAAGDSTVGGGALNTASGWLATVPGGFANTAQGNYSFAAGQQAQANHSGTFVWADATGTPFASTGPQQFDVRATGGVNLVVGMGNARVNGVPLLTRALAPTANMAMTVDNAGDVGLYTSLSIGADGLPVVSYYDVTNHDLKVLHCGNALCTSGNVSTTVDSAGDVGLYTSLSIGPDGLPVVSYYDNSNHDLKVLRCGNLLCNLGNTVTTVDSAGDVGSHTSLSMGAGGLPVVSYYDSTNGDLKVLHCGNYLCDSANTITTVSSASPSVGLYTSLSIGADGLPVVSSINPGYSDGYYGYLAVLHCGNALCNSGNTFAGADDNSLKYTSLSIEADGLPVVSYYDGTNHDLKVLHCGNALCNSGNTITTVDSAGDVGLYTSLSIGVDGLPVVSYYDGTNHDLKALHCGNALCNSSNVSTTVDSAGDVGLYTSLSIGADGLPVVSYYDYTNGDLKVLHCANPFCVPYFRRR